MNWINAILTVLENSQHPMDRDEIIDAIIAQNLMKIRAKNPYNSSNRSFQELLDTGQIIKVAKGVYQLKH